MVENFILSLIHQGRLAEARTWLSQMNVVDIAYWMEELDDDSILVLFRLLPKDTAAEVFSHFSKEQQEFIIESIADREIKGIIDELFLDDTVDLIEEMPANVVKKVLRNTSEERRKLINQFLKYPENSAGSLMTIEFVDLKKEMRVDQALESIRKNGVDKETINICYVIDSNRKLEGIIPIRKLILSDLSENIENIMETNIISVHTLDDQEEVANIFRKYDLIAVPVVDNENRLVGIITVDDIVDIIEEENTEDFHKMAAMQPSDEEYLKTKVTALAKHRVIWLLVLMISATFTGTIIQKFEEVLQSVVVLTYFIPMIMDTGGNAGAQSATLIIRGLALDEIDLSDILKVIWKELKVSLLVGVTLAIINFARIIIMRQASVMIAATVSVSMLLTVILAKVIGGSLPILAKKIGLDPAIMAGPLITTIVDALALLAYFSMASWVLGL
ncbi:MAG: magnesium transporter [Caldicoprobacterales bacterium]|jgi:magnesium transporter|nr:magnesium transporter [Clostridiales bacterium]